MKHLIFCLPVALLLAIFASSCNNDDDYPRTGQARIYAEFPIYHFEKESLTNAQIGAMQQAYIINSEKQLGETFTFWGLTPPDELKGNLYDKQTLLLVFKATALNEISIKHTLTKTFENKTTYSFAYYITTTCRPKETGAPTTFYYSGILTDKIPDDATIQTTFQQQSLIQ